VKNSESYQILKKPDSEQDNYYVCSVSPSQGLFMVGEVVEEKLTLVEIEVLWEAKSNIGFYTCVILDLAVLLIFAVLKVI
jgi:hypothetical protein